MKTRGTLGTLAIATLLLAGCGTTVPATPSASVSPTHASDAPESTPAPSPAATEASTLTSIDIGVAGMTLANGASEETIAFTDSAQLLEALQAALGPGEQSSVTTRDGRELDTYTWDGLALTLTTRLSDSGTEPSARVRVTSPSVGSTAITVGGSIAVASTVDEAKAAGAHELQGSLALYVPTLVFDEVERADANSLWEQGGGAFDFVALEIEGTSVVAISVPANNYSDV